MTEDSVDKGLLSQAEYEQLKVAGERYIQSQSQGKEIEVTEDSVNKGLLTQTEYEQLKAAGVRYTQTQSQGKEIEVTEESVNKGLLQQGYTPYAEPGKTDRGRIRRGCPINTLPRCQICAL